MSVIITTKNEEKNIGNCLKSIRAQSYPQDKIEIIVVDNNSTDKTKEIIRSFRHSLRTCHSEGSEESRIQRFLDWIEKEGLARAMNEVKNKVPLNLEDALKELEK